MSDFVIEDDPDNDSTIQSLGYDYDSVKDEILGLATINYAHGPEIDRDGYAGELWIFGKVIQNQEVYIKLKVKDLNSDGNKQLNTLCISFHFSKYPLKYPFK